LLLCVGLLVGIPHAAYADSMSSSSISFSNLQIDPASGSVAYGTWTSQPYSEADNSLGEIDFGTTSAGVTFASASGNASASLLTGTATGNSNIVGTTASAETTGQGILTNTFMITGGTGSVNVTFSTDLSGDVQAANDAEGVLATAEAAFNLNVNGNPELFFDSPISVGSSAFLNSPFCYGTGGCSQAALSNTVSLNYNTPYTIYVQADAETSAYNITPEPSVADLSLVALLGITAYAMGGRRRWTLGQRGLD
jgi:hypothetical protein